MRLSNDFLMRSLVQYDTLHPVNPAQFILYIYQLIMYKFLIYVKKLDEEYGVLYLYLSQDGKVVYNFNLYCKIIIRQDWITDKEKGPIQCILIPAPYFLFFTNSKFYKRGLPIYLQLETGSLTYDTSYLQWRETCEFTEEIDEILKFI